MLSNFALIEMICPKVWARPLAKNVKRSLTVDLRRSKTSLLKSPILYGFQNGLRYPLVH